MKQVELELIEISKVAKSRECLSGYDDQLNCPIIDEDKVSLPTASVHKRPILVRIA